jgi:chaperonin GroES
LTADPGAAYHQRAIGTPNRAVPKHTFETAGPVTAMPLSWSNFPMKFRPLHDRVVVKRVDSDTKTTGGIIIPDTAAEKPQEGEVVAVGPGARDETGKVIPIELKKGDKILFGKWSGTEVKIDGQELLIMKESDVMGVLEA